MNVNRIIETFVADMIDNGTPAKKIAVRMNTPAIDRRWPSLPVQRIRATEADARRYGDAMAAATDVLGNVFAVDRNGNRRQFLRGERITWK